MKIAMTDWVLVLFQLNSHLKDRNNKMKFELENGVARFLSYVKAVVLVVIICTNES